MYFIPDRLDNKNQLTVLCTNHGERRLISMPEGMFGKQIGRTDGPAQ